MQLDRAGLGKEARGRGRGRTGAIVGRHVALEVEQAFDGVEDFVAASAPDPAFGDLELVLNDTKGRVTGGAAGGKTHGLNDAIAARPVRVNSCGRRHSSTALS